MSELRNFRMLHPHFRDRPHLQGAVADYFRSPAYLARLAELEADPEFQTRLAIAQIGVMALDPLTGKTVSDFLSHYPGEGVGATLPFRGVCSFGNACVMAEPGSQLAQDLLHAIEANLSSKMFKAATMAREMTYPRKPKFKAPLMNVLFSQADDRARAAAAEIRKPLSALYADLRTQSSATERTNIKERIDAIDSAAHERYREVRESGRERLQQRHANLSRAAYHPDFQGSWIDMLVEMAIRLIVPPEISQELKKAA